MSTHHLHPRTRHRLEYFGELIFLFDLMFASLVLGIVLLGGINPFDSPLATVLLIATVVIGTAHHVWYTRNRDAIEHDPGRQHARERRGF